MLPNHIVFLWFDFGDGGNIPLHKATYRKPRAKRTQHCLPATQVWMLHVASVLHVAACCMELLRSLKPVKHLKTTPNISFLPWSPKRSATMLDPFAQLFQHCWDHAHPLNTDYKDCILPMMHRRSQHCWKLLHPFAHPTSNTDATAPNNVGPTMLGVVASFCT